jgi:hypothetical protein
MIRKPLDLPPAVARAFFKAMRDYFAEEDKTNRDAIAAHQLKNCLNLQLTAATHV